MKTTFYKILNENNEVIYIGVTTRDINKRFREHRKQKHLNKCKIEKICFIEHSEINSLDKFREEQRKVSDLEISLIKEYKNKGYNLINISIGGQWGSQILNKMIKNNFLEKYEDFNLFQQEYNNYLKYIRLINNWILHKNENKYKCLLRHWISHRKTTRYKLLLQNWIIVRSKSKYKLLLRHWVEHKSVNKYKQLIWSWIVVKSKSRYKQLLQHWIYHRSKNKTKQWLSDFINHRKGYINANSIG